MPVAEFGFPGPLRDRLVAAVLDGTKTAATSLLAEYESSGEALPQVGTRSSVTGSDGQPVAVVEVTDVCVVPLSEVPLVHAVAEGEGYSTVAEWRAGHEEFWHSPELRAELGDPAFTADDSTLVVLERFRTVIGLDGPSH